MTHLSIEQRFANIQRCGDGSCEGPRNSARNDVTHWVIGACWVDGILHRFVDDEVDTLERYVHDYLRAVGAVKRAQPFAAVDFYRAVCHRAVRTVVHL